MNLANYRGAALALVLCLLVLSLLGKDSVMRLMHTPAETPPPANQETYEVALFGQPNSADYKMRATLRSPTNTYPYEATTTSTTTTISNAARRKELQDDVATHNFRVASEVSADNTLKPKKIKNEFRTPSGLSRKQCREKYGTRRYLEESEKRSPPLFYSYPGAGNTWGRLLIEYASGIYTGAVYSDSKLLEALPGEYKCNWFVSAVKAHPHTHPFEHLYRGRFLSDHRKCEVGKVNTFSRVILQIRNPYDAIWSEYQRRVSQSHVEGIRKSMFDWYRWQANAASMSSSYFEMWNRDHAFIDKKLRPGDVLNVRYEDLKDKHKRVATLKTIADFLQLPGTKGLSDAALTERLECAFVLAESRHALRKANSSDIMTKHVAYTKPLACRMWAKFGRYAATANYRVWADYNCTPAELYPPIPDVRVGSQGEYDSRHVKPGSKPIDFGGWDKNQFPKFNQLSPVRANNNPFRFGAKQKKSVAKRPTDEDESAQLEMQQGQLLGNSSALVSKSSRKFKRKDRYKKLNDMLLGRDGVESSGGNSKLSRIKDVLKQATSLLGNVGGDQQDSQSDPQSDPQSPGKVLTDRLEASHRVRAERMRIMDQYQGRGKFARKKKGKRDDASGENEGAKEVSDGSEQTHPRVKAIKAESQQSNHRGDTGMTLDRASKLTNTGKPSVGADEPAWA